MGSRACISSDEITASEATYTGHGVLWTVFVMSNTAQDPTIIIYDNSSAAAPKLFEVTLDVSLGPASLPVPLGKGVAFKKGLYTSVAGTGASCILHYQPEV